MTKRAFIFRNPWLYSFSIKLLHFSDFNKIAEIVGKKKNVFEPACGSGRLKKYLHDSCTYSGIDLNEIFIKFGKKRGLDIRIGDVLEEKNYIKSDIIILCDILHHLTKDNVHKLVALAKKFANEKVLILEPSFLGIASGRGFFSRLIAKIFTKWDSDGINKIEHWLNRQDYHELFKQLKETNKFASIKIQRYKRYYFVELISA